MALSRLESPAILLPATTIGKFLLKKDRLNLSRKSDRQADRRTGPGDRLKFYGLYFLVIEPRANIAHGVAK